MRGLLLPWNPEGVVKTETRKRKFKNQTRELAGALATLEKVQEDLKSEGADVAEMLTPAASHTRRALRALGMDIPVRKGPKPKVVEE